MIGGKHVVARIPGNVPGDGVDASDIRPRTHACRYRQGFIGMRSRFFEPVQSASKFRQPVGDRPAPAIAKQSERCAGVVVLDERVVAACREIGITGEQRDLSEIGQRVTIATGKRPLDDGFVGDKLLRERLVPNMLVDGQKRLDEKFCFAHALLNSTAGMLRRSPTISFPGMVKTFNMSSTVSR